MLKLARGLGPFVAAGLVACGSETATGIGEELFPIHPQTIEVRLPWSEFGVGFDVIGGFGLVSEVPGILLAHQHQGGLEARALAGFLYPANVNARDTAGILRADSAYAPIGGRLVIRFDTTLERASSDVTASLIEMDWDPRTVTWEAAVDSLGELEPWPEPGAGPAVEVGTSLWFPDVSDSVTIEVDSAAAAIWGDTARASGVRISLGTPDRFARMLSVALRVDTRPSVDPDTVVTVTAATRNLAFIYSPSPGDPTGSLRVGGAPAWRSVLRLDVPMSLDGPPSLCARVACPFVIDPSRVNLASLILTTAMPPPGFQPIDTTFVDARAVLSPELLPKSPLGGSFVFGGVPVAPGAFEGGDPVQIDIPVTSFVQSMLRGESQSGGDPLNTIAIMDGLEPAAVSFASFVGPGEEGEPSLRLIVTTADTVQIR